MKQSISIGMKNGTKVLLAGFPTIHATQTESRVERPRSHAPKAQGGSPASPWGWGTALLANFWKTAVVLVGHYQPCPAQAQSEGCAWHPGLPLQWGCPGRLRSALKEKPQAACSSFPPPHSRAQPSTVTKALYNTSPIPFWVCPHTHCCVRLDTPSSLKKPQPLPPNGQGFHAFIPEPNTRIFYLQGFFADSCELLQKPEQTPGRLISLQPWLPPDISRLVYFPPCQGALLRHSGPVRSKGFPSAKLHSSAANYCRSGKQRKEQAKLEPGNSTGIRIPSQL